MNLEVVQGIFPYCDTVKPRLQARLSSKDIRRHTHNWIVAELLIIGEELGFRSVPEYQVAINGRSGKGSIDVVWLEDAVPAYGFEVGFSHGKPRELAKLRQVPNGILVQLRRAGIKKRNMRKSMKLG